MILRIIKLIALFHNQMSYGAEIVPLAEMFFKNEFALGADEKEFLAQEGVKETLTIFAEKLTAATDFSAETIKAIIKETGKDAGAKGKMLFMPARIATTGQMHGPELPLTIELFGQDESVRRVLSVVASL